MLCIRIVSLMNRRLYFVGLMVLVWTCLFVYLNWKLIYMIEWIWIEYRFKFNQTTLLFIDRFVTGYDTRDGQALILEYGRALNSQRRRLVLKINRNRLSQNIAVLSQNEKNTFLLDCDSFVHTNINQVLLLQI